MVSSLATFNLLLVFTTILSTFSGFPMYSCNDYDHDHEEHIKNIEFKIYCSTSLSDTLELICGGKFYSFSKKFPQAIGGASARSYKESTLLRKLVGEEKEKEKTDSSSTHECCKRPCGYSELRLYCANI